MNSEQSLIDKWRSLTSLQQQEVLDFVEFIAQKSLPENQHGDWASGRNVRAPHHQSRQRTQRVKKWLDWAEDNPAGSPGLPAEALSRDNIYD